MKIPVQEIRKGDLVRLRLPDGEKTGEVFCYGRNSDWGYSTRSCYPYDKDTWFEVTAPFKGADALTLTFARLPDQKPISRGSISSDKQHVTEVLRPDKAPIYKKQLILF